MSLNDYTVSVAGLINSSLSYDFDVSCLVPNGTQVLLEFLNETNNYGQNMPVVRVKDIVANLQQNNCNVNFNNGFLSGTVAFYF